MANVFDGYPGAQGHKTQSVIEVVGPASYTQIGVAVPPTGGQSVLARTFGLKAIESCEASGSDDGTYAVRVFYPNGASARPSASVTLQWITAATGAEVAALTVLSGRTIRLRAVGN